MIAKGTTLVQTPLEDFLQAARGLRLPIPLGTDDEGEIIVRCLAADNSHVLIGGLTRSGKSRHIHAIINTIVATTNPADVEIFIIDLKGGVEFSRYSHFEHIKVPPIMECTEASGALGYLKHEGNRRLKLMKEAGCTNIDSFNELQYQLGRCQLARQLLIIDEVHLISKKSEEFLKYLTSVSLAWGLLIIVGTQRPCSKNLETCIKANIRGRISYQTVDKSNARIMHDGTGAETLLPRQLIAALNSYSGTLTAPLISDDDINKGRPNAENSLLTTSNSHAVPKLISMQEYLDSDHSLQTTKNTEKKTKRSKSELFVTTEEQLDGVVEPISLYKDEVLTIRPTIMLKHKWRRSSAVDVWTGRFLTTKGVSRAFLAILSKIRDTSWDIIEKIAENPKLSRKEIGMAYELFELGLVHGTYKNIELAHSLKRLPLINLPKHHSSVVMPLSHASTLKLRKLRGAMQRLSLHWNTPRKHELLVVGLPYFKDGTSLRAAWKTRFDIRFEEEGVL